MKELVVPIEDLPEWANFQATDEDGEVWVYETRPKDLDVNWDAGGWLELINKGPAFPNWRESLIDLRPLRAAMVKAEGRS